MSPAILRIAPLCALVLAFQTLPAAAQLEKTHLIQISLLAASRSGPNELADLPANTRQAIEDARAFLPFKSYRLLDTAIVRTDRYAQTMLTGPDKRQFRATFSLDGRHASGSLAVRNFDLVEKIKLSPPPPPSGGEGDRAAPASPASRQVLSSSFAAAIGQTVVVGTSRTNGDDEALMVLFTALP